jgi:L-amino acid N-acyltransferase YncA
LPSSLQGARAPEAYVDQALRWCDDEAWAEGFARACPVEGASARDYLQRVLSVADGEVLAGIRFKGGDLDQPFVDLVAWDRDLAPVWPAVVEAVRAAFAVFAPPRVRLHVPAGARPPGAGAEPDLHLVAGRVSALRADARPWPPGVTIERQTMLALFDAYEREFAAWQAGAGALAREVGSESRESLQRCLDDGALVAMFVDGAWAGLAGARRARLWALDGFEVAEELVTAGFRGRGLGPWLQRGLIDALDALDDPKDDALLAGTIHATNAPSLATARRCGREVVATSWFVPVT